MVKPHGVRTLERIDRSKLYSDSAYRYTYMTKFLDFDQSDVDAIDAVSSHLLPLVPQLVNAVYEKLFSFDVTKQSFLRRNEGFTGKLTAGSVDEISADDEQIVFRKGMLSRYFGKLLSEPFDEKMVSYLDRVARIHTDTPTKKSRIQVEYVHIGALLGYVESLLVGAVKSLDEIDLDTKFAAINAVNKLIWVQNDMFARYYTHDGDDVEGNFSGVAKSGFGHSAVSARDASLLTAAAVAGGVLVTVLGHMVRSK